MEENQNFSSQTMNLNNLSNMGGIPVTEPTSTVSIYSPVQPQVQPQAPVYNQQTGVDHVVNSQDGITVNPSYIPTPTVATTVTVESTPVPPVSEPTQPQQPVQPTTMNNLAIPAIRLKKLLKAVMSTAICEPNIPISNIIEFTFANEGLTAKASESANMIVYHDPTYRFTKAANLSLEAKLLDNLMSKVDDDELITITPSPETGSALITISSGEFIVSERNDSTTGEPIHIIPAWEASNTEPIKIDYAKLKDKLTRAFVLASKGNVTAATSGVYLDGNKIISSDGNGAYVCDNLPELANERFCMSREMINILSSVELDSTKSTMSFNKDANGVIQAIFITDGNVTVSGIKDQNESIFPLEALHSIVSMTANRAFETTLSKQEVAKILARLNVFVSVLSDKDIVEFSINEQSIAISNKNGRAKQEIKLQERHNPIPKFGLSLQLAITTFNNFAESDIKFSVCNESMKVVVLEVEGITQIMCTQDED